MFKHKQNQQQFPVPNGNNIMKDSQDVFHADQRSQPSSYNVDKPADDGYNWRKYGKKVKGSELFPRSYYKCAHPSCPVKKKVERSHDGQVTEIIYQGQHKHAPPQTSKRSKETGSEFGAEGLTLNFDRRMESGPSYSISVNHQDRSHVTGLSDSDEVGDAETRGQGKDDDEPESKRRNTEIQAAEPALSHRTVTEPRIIIQTTSEVDLLDGYAWRKYGQKFAKGNPYPSSYYKCANQGCPARKLIERKRDDPNYNRATYHGVHKCSSNHPWVPSPEYLERCSSYCWLFPPGYEFERDSMVQLWIAEEVIDGDATERLEDKGYICLELLLSLGVIEPSGLHKRDYQSKFKVSQHFISEHFANRGNLEDDFLIIGKNGFSNISRMPLHLSLLVERFDCQIPELLQMRQRLRTLLLLGESKYLVKKVPRDLFLSLNLLRTLVLSGTRVSELPSSVGNLEDLRYFDLSGTPLKELPGVLCDVVSLQTLKLRDCSEFTALPKGMMKLINLRHLDLDIVHQLSYMPKSIGKLINLQTFKGFIVGTEEDCGIGELSQLNNITGSFSISCLENVSNAEEAKKANLRSKSHITKLVLRWEECINAETEQEILECLLPHPNLSELQIQFFSGSALPSWISDPSFTNLISITFYKCINSSFLPSIGNLRSLKFLNILGMDKVMDIDGLFSNNNEGSSHHLFFPELEKWIIDSMAQLEKWTLSL